MVISLPHSGPLGTRTIEQRLYSLAQLVLQLTCAGIVLLKPTNNLETEQLLGMCREIEKGSWENPRPYSI